MSNLRQSLALVLAAFFATAIGSCTDHSIGPGLEDKIEPPPTEGFRIVSDNVTATEDGYRFDGTLVALDGNGDEFVIGVGEFEVTLGVDGSVISINGVGIPEFPDIGMYAEILKEFSWDSVESHILYMKGSELLEETGTEVPLNPDRFYATYRVFDESKNEGWGLRGKGNDIVHKFNEIYIDPEDPAVFLKFQVWVPRRAASSGDVAQKFWAKVGANAKALGQNVQDYKGAPGLIVGLSNTGTFLTPEYELGLRDSDAFENLYGFPGMEPQSANMFLGVSGIPIPKTGILRLNGEVFVGYVREADDKNHIDRPSPGPEHQAAVNWFVEQTPHLTALSYRGSIDFGGKGIAMIVSTLLPTINEWTGRDIFDEDIDLELLGGFVQARTGIDEQFGDDDEGFLRLGGNSQDLVIKPNLLGPVSYLVPLPPLGPAGLETTFVYLDVPSDLEEASLFVEEAYHFVVPFWDNIEFQRGHFRISRHGIEFFGRTGVDLGPIKLLNMAVEGHLQRDGYLLSGSVEHDIELGNGLTLGNLGLTASIASDSGIGVDGEVALPFEIRSATASGQLTTDGFTMSGTVNSGTQLPLLTGMSLPTRELQFAASNDPEPVIELHGETQVPFVGYSETTGSVTADRFLLEGVINATLQFGSLDVPFVDVSLLIDSDAGVFTDGSFEIPFVGSLDHQGEITNDHIHFASAVNENMTFQAVSLPVSNGSITLSDAGAFLDGTLVLPHNLQTSRVSGSITESEVELTGSMASELLYHGHSFVVTNSDLTASTTSGVSAEFNIRLNSNLAPKVSGALTGGGYSFTGSRGFVRTITWQGAEVELSGTLDTQLTQNGITLAGSGTVTGPLGGELWSGNLSVTPNWATRTITVCTTGAVQACANI